MCRDAGVIWGPLDNPNTLPVELLAKNPLYVNLSEITAENFGATAD